MNIRTGTVQNMGALTEKVFRGDGESLAVIKTYKESIGVFAKAISARLKYGGMPVEYESIADFGSFSGEFLEKVLDELDLEGVYFKRKYALELNGVALAKNIIATDKIACDLTQVPIQENSFDVSIVRYVLQWNSLKRQKEIIREIARTTKNFAVIQHPAVETTEQEKLQRLFDGTIVSKLKRSESFYSTKEQMEDIFRDNGLSFELIDSEFIKDASDVFIERYELTPEEFRDLKYFLGSDDWWNRTTWVVWK